MTRVRFTPDDLLLTRFSVAPAPLIEAYAGLAELRRGVTLGRSWWAGHARRAFPATARPLLELVPVTLPGPAFLDPAVPDVDEGLEIVRATPRSVLRDEVPRSWRGTGRPPHWLQALADGDVEVLEAVTQALRDFYLACIEPQWKRITVVYRADVAERTQVLTIGGLARVLGMLHDDLGWRDGSLERFGRRAEYSLEGRGLLLVPSALWTGPPMFAFSLNRRGGNALVYPARPLDPAASAGPPSNLAGLLGQTRAAVLDAVRTPCSTTELAASVGISAPSASEHASVLRSAGLVNTVRRGRGVSHSLTPLGQSLLSAQDVGDYENKPGSGN